MKTKLLALSIMLSLFYSGCSSNKLAKPRVPQTLKTNAASVMYKVSDYEKDLAAYKTAFNSDLAKATNLRDAMINRIRIDIEANYRDYETLLFFDRASFNIGADFLELGLALATTISNGERVKTVLGAVSTAFKGNRLSIDKNLFLEKSTGAIISKMQANRTDIRNRIIDKMVKLPADQYTFEEAFVDLTEFFHAGTLQAAVVSIANEVGKDAVEAQERTEDIESFRTASKGDLLTLEVLRKDFRELFRNWRTALNDQEAAKPFLDKAKAALRELGVPFNETATGGEIFKSLNEQITKVRPGEGRSEQLKRLTEAFKKAEISR